jgi:hypothetical protein
MKKYSLEVEFFADLVNALVEILKKKPYLEDLLPRVISNPIFDYTPTKKYLVGRLYHKDGNMLKKIELSKKKEAADKEIESINHDIRNLKGEIAYTVGLRPIKEYADKLKTLREQKRALYEKKKGIEASAPKNISRGLSSGWLVEHVHGRDAAAKKAIEFAIQRGGSLSIPDADTFLKVDGATIWLERHTDEDGVQWHTKANKAVKRTQKGDFDFNEYIEITEDHGYINAEGITKGDFPTWDK